MPDRLLPILFALLVIACPCSARTAPPDIETHQDTLRALRACDEERTELLHKALAQSIEIYGIDHPNSTGLRNRLIEEGDLRTLSRDSMLTDLIEDTYTGSSGNIDLIASMLTTLWMRADRLREANPHPSQPVYINMVPPGGEYPSGITPETIKEPETRAQYEAMLRRNALHAAALNRATSADRAHKTLMTSMKICLMLIRHHAPTDDFAELLGRLREGAFSGSEAVLEEFESENP